MASWQAHFASKYSKYFVKPKLNGLRDVARLRNTIKFPEFELPVTVRTRRDERGGVRGEWVESDGADRTLLYLHGGGYVQGSAEARRPITAFFAQQGFRVFAPDYRLAPENPFPAAVHDAVAAYLELAEEGLSPVYLAGDSAGGGLALALMVFLRDSGSALPPAAALFSPWTDLGITGQSVRYNEGRCALFHGGDMHFVANLYLGDADARHPLASPLHADFEKLPPILIHVGEDETLLDDSTRTAARARVAGVKVELKVWPVVHHGWQLAHTVIPEGRESLREAAEFLLGAEQNRRVQLQRSLVNG